MTVFNRLVASMTPGGINEQIVRYMATVTTTQQHHQHYHHHQQQQQPAPVTQHQQQEQSLLGSYAQLASALSAVLRRIRGNGEDDNSVAPSPPSPTQPTEQHQHQHQHQQTQQESGHVSLRQALSAVYSVHNPTKLGKSVGRYLQVGAG